MIPRRCALGPLLAVIALLVHVPSASAESVATVLSMNGPADIEKRGATVVGVTTGPDTTVIVQIDATHEVTVYQNSQLRIGDVLLGEALVLRVGTMRVRGALTVTTANAQSSVRDSEMTVAYDDTSGITTVEVVDRDAVIRGINDTSDQRVPAGQTVRVGRDGAGTAPQATDAQAFGLDQIGAARVVSTGRGDTAGEGALPYLVVVAASACLLVGVTGLVATRRSRPPRPSA